MRTTADFTKGRANPDYFDNCVLSGCGFLRFVHLLQRVLKPVSSGGSFELLQCRKQCEDTVLHRGGLI